MKDKYEYVIGGKVYTMKPLVLGQVNQLINLIKDVNLPSEPTIANLMLALGDKLPEAVAIILHVPEVSLKQKNIKELSEEISFEMSPELTLEIVEDFFDCIPLSLLLAKITETIKRVTEKMGQETGSQTSV